MKILRIDKIWLDIVLFIALIVIVFSWRKWKI